MHVALRSAHGTYVSAWDGATTTKQIPHCKGWEIFKVHRYDSGKCTFQTNHGSFLSAWDVASVKQKDHELEWEQITVAVAPNNPAKVVLQTHHGTYLTAWHNETLTQQGRGMPNNGKKLTCFWSPPKLRCKRLLQCNRLLRCRWPMTN